MPEENWNDQAKGILKAQLARKNIKYHDLARRLNAIGIEENQNTIATKLSRGAHQINCVNDKPHTKTLKIFY